jgi:hypothetical protein
MKKCIVFWPIINFTSNIHERSLLMLQMLLIIIHEATYAHLGPAVINIQQKIDKAPMILLPTLLYIHTYFLITCQIEGKDHTHLKQQQNSQKIHIWLHLIQIILQRGQLI